PASESRPLYAGRRAGSKRMSPALLPGQRLLPGFDVVPTLSTLHQGFTCVRLSEAHLTRSRRAFSGTLTTGAFDPSRFRGLGPCLRSPAPRGLPSSRTDIAGRTVVAVAALFQPAHDEGVMRLRHDLLDLRADALAAAGRQALLGDAGEPELLHLRSGHF